MTCMRETVIYYLFGKGLDSKVKFMGRGSICMAIEMRELVKLSGTHGLNEDLGRYSDRVGRVECM